MASFPSPAQRRRAKAKRDAWNAAMRRRLPPPEPLNEVKADAEEDMRWFDQQPRAVRDRINYED